MKKILITSTELMMLHFLLPHVRYLQKNGFKVEVACSEVGGRFQEVVDTVPEDTIVHRVHLFRTPVKLGNIKGYFELKEILKKGRYDIVWTNEPVMGVMTRLAAKKLRKYGLRVIYMAHGFHFFKGAPLKNWLFFYPIERICSRWTDVLVTINKEDYALAKKKMHAKQVKYISGIGIDIEKFKTGNREENRKCIRGELGIPKEGVFLLSVGELNKNKNHKVVIQAMAEIPEEARKNVYYMIAGTGKLKGKLKSFIKKSDLENQIFLLGFRKDVDKLYDAADVFIFPSHREGLSVALMEAMASGLPCIASRIRGNTDLLIDGKGGYLCGADDIKGFAGSIAYLLKDSLKRDAYGKYNQNRIKEFDIRIVEEKVRKICGAWGE